MVMEIIYIGFCFICVLAVSLLQCLASKDFDKERKEWREERSKLLDRIQSGGLAEFKAQERADTPIKRREKDPLLKKLDGEPWA